MSDVPNPAAPDSAAEIVETFLTDRGQPPEQPANLIASFISAAKQSIDIAIYDFKTDDSSGSLIAKAILDAIARGVRVRGVHNVEHPAGAGRLQPPKTPEKMGELGVLLHPVSEEGALMHHKYVVRDGTDVLTGSTNWTDDAFGREENFLMTIAGSPSLAGAYAGNFEHLYQHGHIRGSGGEGPEITLKHGVRVRPHFSPRLLGSLAASIIVRADRRLRIVSPVITSGAVLGVLAEAAGHQHLDLTGAYDFTQMQEVQQEWRAVPHNRWKIEAWRVIAPRLSGKRSTPWRPDSVHDFMHAKFVVADDEVLAGSYNLSNHGELNAENVLHIVSEFHAVAFSSFAEKVAARYRAR